jgi:transposase
MAIRDDKFGQSLLLPVRITDLIPNDHICKLAVAVVERVDVRWIEKRFRGQPGNPAYPRRMLFRLMLQAAIDGVWSSRKIERLTYKNVVYMHLSGLEHPNFRTLCNFRRENRELIDDAFRQTGTIARELIIMSLGHLAADGTKLKANASNVATLSKEELEVLRQLIERGIAVDEAEDEQYGETRGDGLPPEFATQEKLKTKLEELDAARGKRLKRAARAFPCNTRVVMSASGISSRNSSKMWRRH